MSACWQTKASLAIGLSVFFCVPYFLIGNFPILPVHELPLTEVDRAIGYHPYEWVWAYQSVYLFINVIPWLATRRDELRKYARGFITISAVSFAVFILFPVRSPKPAVDGASGMYWLLQSYDVPLNALPSLHAGLLVLSLCFGRRILPVRPVGLGSICVTWGILILYGTLATKEHYLLDIVCGTMLAVAVDAWVWRSGRSSSVTAAAADLPGREPLPAES